MFGRGAKFLGEGVAERGKGLGQEGWGKDGGVRGLGKGAREMVSIYLNEIFNKTA